MQTDGRPFDWSTGGARQTVVGSMELWVFEKLADRTGAGWHSLDSAPVEMMITIASSSG